MGKPSEFITSAQIPEQYPEPSLKEVAIIGRSNAGKSSLLNILLKTNIVKTSSKPGKTQLINFFTKEGKYIFVDLPGYGYAEISEEKRTAWQNMIEAYLENRETLVGAVLVMDSRREWQQEEIDLRNWLHHKQIPFAIAMNKTDKLKKAEVPRIKNSLVKAAETQFVFETSCEEKTGITELENFIFKTWIKDTP